MVSGLRRGVNDIFAFINTPTKLRALYNTFKSKYETPTCFGTEVPSSGSYLNKGV
jgi:hypothetical protein